MSSNGYIEHSPKQLSSGQAVLFRAPSNEIRQERTGVHAKVGIFLETDGKQMLLEIHTFNVSRLEERVKLANAAHKALDAISADEYSSAQLRHDLSIYCSLLWNDSLTALLPTLIPGDSMGEPLRFLLKPYIIEGGGTIIFAPPGKGKSYTAMLMAVSVDAGNTHLFEVNQAKVLLINLERPANTISRRLGCVNTALGEDPARPLTIMNARGKSLRDIEGVVKRAVEEQGIEAVFLDSISRAGHGDLTENRPVNQIMDTMNSICPSWFAIAHTPRQDESHVYGSIYFEAAADIVIQMLYDQEDEHLGVGLKVVKGNDLGKQPVLALRYDFDQDGLVSAQKASLRDFKGLKTQTMSTEDEMLEYLRHEVGRADADELARVVRKSRNYISQTLSADPRFVRVAKDGRKQMWGAQGTDES
jgi:hypothetical protein